MAANPLSQERASVSVRLRQPDKEALTAGEVLRKIDKLSFYIKKAEARLASHSRTLENLIDRSKKDKDLIRAGLKLYGVSDQEVHI